MRALQTIVIGFLGAVRCQLPNGAGAMQEDTPSRSVSAHSARRSILIDKPAPPLNLVLHDGTTRTLASYRGQWVFLVLGGTWCPTSQQMAHDLSDLARLLQDQSFNAIMVYDDPTFEDVDLHTYFPVAHIEALPDGELPSEWEVSGIPTAFLIDPKGTVVSTWVGDGAAELRAELHSRIGGRIVFPRDFLEVQPGRTEEEEASSLAHRGDYADALSRYEKLVQQYPDSEAIRIAYSWCLDYHRKNTDGIQWMEKQMEDPARASDAVQFDLAEKWIYHWKFDAAEKAVEPILAKYPHSVRAKAIHLISTQRPETISADDLSVLLPVPDMGWPVYGFAAFAAENLGQEEVAARCFARMNDGWEYEAMAGYLARRGKSAEAAQIVTRMDGTLTPAQAEGDRNVSWKAMWRHLDALDWAGAKAYADAHTKSTPWNAAGGVIRLLVAVRTGDAAAKDAAWKELSEFKSDRKAYQFAQGVMKGAPVTEVDIAAFAKDDFGYVGWLWAAAALEAQGKTEEARQVYTWALARSDYSRSEYWQIFGLRSTLGKVAAASAPASAPTPSLDPVPAA